MAMTDEPAPKLESVKLLSASGVTMMEVERMGQEGGRLKIQGKMMGEFPQAIFLGTDQLIPMVRMGFRPGVLLFFWLGLCRAVLAVVASGRFLRRGPGEAGFASFLAGLTAAAPLALTVVVAAVVLTPVMFAALALGALIAPLARARPKEES